MFAICLLATAVLVGWTLLAGISLWALKGSLGVELDWPPVDLLVMPFLVLFAAWYLFGTEVLRARAPWRAPSLGLWSTQLQAKRGCSS